jgi:hypothetical protein
MSTTGPESEKTKTFGQPHSELPNETLNAVNVVNAMNAVNSRPVPTDLNKSDVQPTLPAHLIQTEAQNAPINIPPLALQSIQQPVVSNNKIVEEDKKGSDSEDDGAEEVNMFYRMVFEV